MFQVLANGLVFCETPNYEDARAVWQDVVDLNTPATKEHLQ